MQGDLFGRLLPWLAGLLAVGKPPAGRREGFELDDLRSLLDRGEISPEEYDRARRRMVDRARGSRPAGKPSGKGR